MTVESYPNAALSAEVASQVGTLFPSATVTVLRYRDWSSALFSGVRVTVAIEQPEGSEFDQAVAHMTGEWEPRFTAHFAASCDLISRSDQRAEVELLLVDEN